VETVADELGDSPGTTSIGVEYEPTLAFAQSKVDVVEVRIEAPQKVAILHGDVVVDHSSPTSIFPQSVCGRRGGRRGHSTIVRQAAIVNYSAKGLP
jgi:hypothetical protein